MFRFLALVAVSLGAAGALAGSKYRAIDLGAYPELAYDAFVCGVGSDGSIGYFHRSSPTGTGIYANGQFRSLEQITGIPFTGNFSLKDRDHWGFGRGFPAYFRFGDEGVWEGGSSGLPFSGGGGMSVKRTEWTYYKEENPTLELSIADAFVRRNGVEYLINADVFLKRADFPIDMNEDGWILGGSSGLSVRDFAYESWLLAPDSLTPALIPTNLLTRAYRVSNDGFVYGEGGAGLTRYKIGSTTTETIRGPGNKYIGGDDVYEMNAKGQVAVDMLRAATGTTPLHRSIAVWQNGASAFLEDILVNPGLLPQGESMRGLGINDAGQIATSIQMSDGRYHLFRFDPVPEPATWLALGGGFVVLLRRRRAKSNRFPASG